MTYRVCIPVPGEEVQAWSSVRLPFEPKGWLRDFRRDLAQACRTLVAGPGQVLHATYGSEDRGVVDIENVLTYNLGTAAMCAAAAHGLVLERSFRPVDEPGFRHHHRYRLTDVAPSWAHWRDDRQLATLRFTAPLEAFRAAKAGVWWLHARRRVLDAGPPAVAVPDLVTLRITVSPPAGWTGSLIGLLKPLTDGVVAALQAHDGPLDAVIARAATIDPTLTPDDFAALLRDGAAPLGRTRLVVPRGITLQWLPDDDRIVALDLRHSRGEPPGTITVHARKANPIKLVGEVLSPSM